MAKHQNQSRSNLPNPRPGRGVLWSLVGGAIALVVVLLVAFQGRGSSLGVATAAQTVGGPASQPPKADSNQPPSTTTTKAAEISQLEVAHAVMVTVELDFGADTPTIAQALTQIERRFKPDDGVGRTFAILDAYGEPTPDGKLHISMHVSTEKPGVGALVFKRTGEELWRTQIVKGTNSLAANFAKKGLVILLDNGAGHTVTVDGSNNPKSVLEAKIKEMSATVGEIWPEGSEREVTFLYSACGCPVKVMAMRVGDKTTRTRPLPMIFPDDPAVVGVIKSIMRWD